MLKERLRVMLEVWNFKHLSCVFEVSAPQPDPPSFAVLTTSVHYLKLPKPTERSVLQISDYRARFSEGWGGAIVPESELELADNSTLSSGVSLRISSNT